jgi:hypothetical protein
LIISNDDLYCKLYLYSARAPFLSFPLSTAPQNKLENSKVLLNKIADYCHSLDKKSNEAYFYPLDGHFTPEGNEVVANIFIKKMIPLLNN